MEMQELEISIDRNGHVTIGARGVHGVNCLALTKNIENAIGTVDEREYTAEYYEHPEEISAYRKNGLG